MFVEQKRLMMQEKPLQAAGVIVFNANGEVLLVRHKVPPRSVGNKVGMYGLPAGIRNRSKTLRMTALEELEEEAGIITIPEFLEEFPGNSPEPAWIPRSDETERLIAHRSYLYTGPKKFKHFLDNPETEPGWYSQEQLIQLRGQGLLLPNVFNQINIARRYNNQIFK